MKTLKLFPVIFSLMLSLQTAKANPLMSFIFNELIQEPGNPYGLTLEFTEMTGDLDNFHITTLTDTAAFKAGLVYQQFKTITCDSLEKPLYINPAGDVIRIYYKQNSDYDDELRFGNVDNPMISAPLPNMSICLCDSVFYEYGEGYQEYYRYFSNKPTLNTMNDTIHAKGYITGTVTDEYGYPLPGVKIYASEFENFLQYYSNTEGYSDASGHFTIFNLARLEKLSFSKDGYQTTKLDQQIWPDSTVVLHEPVVLYFAYAINEKENPKSVQNYTLSQNYPNPFNAATTFNITLPLSDFIDVSVFDLSGRLVGNLYRGYKSRGNHRITWSADNMASGIYIYKLRTSEKTLTRKCILMK